MLLKRGFRIKKISHWFFRYTHYSLFQSFRYFFSPKFAKADAGGLKKSESVTTQNRHFYSLVKEFAKMGAGAFAWAGSIIGSFVGHGEVVTVYVKKA